MARLILTVWGRKRGEGCRWVNFSEKSLKNPRKAPLPSGRRPCVMAPTLSVTAFSVTLTGISLAQTVADGCVSATLARRFASICRAGTLHVIGEKTHVTGRCVQYKADCLGRSWPQAVCLCYRGVEGTRAMLFHPFERPVADAQQVDALRYRGKGVGVGAGCGNLPRLQGVAVHVIQHGVGRSGCRQG